MKPPPFLKPMYWIGASKAELLAFPAPVVKEIGYALYVAQKGEKHESAKPLKGFGGASVLEVVENHVGDTYRAVYTVRFSGRLYVLHAFQKKSKHGIKTPPQIMQRIEQRLKMAEEHYKKEKRV